MQAVLMKIKLLKELKSKTASSSGPYDLSEISFILINRPMED